MEDIGLPCFQAPPARGSPGEESVQKPVRRAAVGGGVKRRRASKPRTSKKRRCVLAAIAERTEITTGGGGSGASLKTRQEETETKHKNLPSPDPSSQRGTGSYHESSVGQGKCGKLANDLMVVSHPTQSDGSSSDSLLVARETSADRREQHQTGEVETIPEPDLTDQHEPDDADTYWQWSWKHDAFVHYDDRIGKYIVYP